MLVVRMARYDDLDGLVALAKTSGGGLTTLPDDADLIAAKLEQVAATLQQNDHQKGLFWFVLEDTDQQNIVGVCGIDCAIGLDQPYYTYRVGTIVHASKELDVYHEFPTLFLTNDHTGCSELCSLYLHPDYRHSKIGALLSKSRFLFIAQNKTLFAEKLIAEMRGYLDDEGISPFWEGLGRHFFDMDFSQADYLSAMTDKQFIAELMPRYPFYTNFLPQSAREVIGQVHKQTLPARKLLEYEGFRYEGYVDIFDAGPTLECYVDRVRAVRDSRLVRKFEMETQKAFPVLVSNTQVSDFRCGLLWPQAENYHAVNVKQLWQQLHLSEQEKARYVLLRRVAEL